MTSSTDLLDSFRSDCDRFVGYGTLGQEMRPPSPNHALQVLSGLHVEMKCWEAGTRPMNARIYAKGNALHNAWTAMRVRGVSMAPDPANLMQETGEVLAFICDKAKLNTQDPVMDWDEIFTLTDFVLKRIAVTTPAGGDVPAVLSTLGMRQKVWSILVKYFVCWHFTQTETPVGNLNLSVDWGRYVHAFHAPLDRRILDTLEALPVGAFLKNFIQNGNLRQTDGTLVPWSKLEDSATWWAYQRLMRRIASVAFPENQAPSLGKVEPCAFADAVDGIPVEVLIESLREMSPSDPSRLKLVASGMSRSTGVWRRWDPFGQELATRGGDGGHSDTVESQESMLVLHSRIEMLETRLTELAASTSTPTPTEGQQAPVSVSSGHNVRPVSNRADAIYLRPTDNSSYIKVLLGPYAGSNFALIGRNLKTLSLKAKCEKQFPRLWEAFHNLTPKPESMGGSTPHGGTGYGGTANISKDDAIKFFLANGFSVIDETKLIHGKPMEHHVA